MSVKWVNLVRKGSIMFTIARQCGALAVVLGALFLSPAAEAQFGRMYPVNPNPQIAPGVSLLQYSYNTAVLGRAYNQIPPYLLGYNPYPSSVNYGPVYNPQFFRGGGYSPYAAAGYGGYGGVPAIAPYAGGYSPYGAGGYGGGYGPGIDPLTGGGYAPYGGGYGAGAELSAYGQLGISQEQARILREVANQAKLDTRKKTVDTLAYIRAHEYTFTQEQADIAKRLLERVQKTPSAAEIQSGKSLNILLDDLVKFNNQQIKGPTINLDEDVLKLVNITGAGSGSANIGLLRDSGRVNWPSAFDNKEVISEKDRNDLTLEAKQLYELAATGQPNVNIVRNVESALQTLRKNLTKQVDNVPSKSYLEGQRFLDDFDAAVVAVKKGDVVLNLDFQQKFVKDGKRSTQELVEYMGGKGLRFAPASVGDDRAYVALQGALSAQSIVIHSQVASSGKAY